MSSLYFNHKALENLTEQEIADNNALTEIINMNGLIVKNKHQLCCYRLLWSIDF